MCSRQRETGSRVIEGRARPRRRVVALRAGLREAGLHVVRLRRALEIFQMTADASCIRAGQAVVAVHMALSALHRGMRSRQREPGCRMIKARVVPVRCGVALLASRRESGLDVIRIGGAVEVLHVARTTIRRCAHKLTINMALGAGYTD